jgi:hypothetical protein
MACRTGRPWRNRHPSMSSTRKCSGNRLPSSAPAADPPPPAPKPRPTTPQARASPRSVPLRDGDAIPVPPGRPARGACTHPPARVSCPAPPSRCGWLSCP